MHKMNSYHINWKMLTVHYVNVLYPRAVATVSETGLLGTFVRSPANLNKLWKWPLKWFCLYVYILSVFQELQKDIEKHGIGVSSVISLCDILSRDHDACPTDVETTAINAAWTSLEKRWKVICDMCLQRKQRLELHYAARYLTSHIWKM